MKLVAIAKLLPTDAQRDALLAAMVRFNAACNWLADEAFAARCTSKYSLQKTHYAALRERFGLSAQTAVRAIAKVCEVYRRDPNIRPVFRSRGAVPYDVRILSHKGNDVSILVIDGRAQMPWVAGGPHADRLHGVWGQSDLVLRKGRWYLYVAVEAPALAPLDPRSFLGVDLGVVNLATDSDGTIHSGMGVEAVRGRMQTRRRELQHVGTRSATRALRRLAGKEARFRADTNHYLSKSLVQRAKDTDRGIALEDLRGIRDRLPVRKEQRARLGGWAFHQLRSFVEYKAEQAGVRVVVVDPRNTSRTCPTCGHCERANRPDQATFRCKSCGFAQHADVVAARNIARRAAVNRPMVSHGDVGNTETLLRVPRPSAETSLGL